MPELNPFAQTIKSLKNALESDETTKGLFVIDLKTSKKFILVKDSQNLIGARSCHYEISNSREPGKFTTDIRFEDSKNPKIYENTSALRENLPKELKLVKGTLQRDHIRYGEGIPNDDPNLVAELKNQLVFMEKNLGDKLREIILANKKNQENQSTMSELNPFARTIQSLKNAVESDETTKGLFVIDVSNNNRKFICVKDSQNLIGARSCHYEISMDKEPDKFTTEIHFEGDDPKIYENTSVLRENLPKELNLIKFLRGRECIRYGDGISKDDPNLVAELKNQLVFLEKNLGDKLREIIKKTKIETPIRYWRIGFDKEFGDYWEYMKTNNKICIGPKISDLSTFEINSKRDIENKMLEIPELKKKSEEKRNNYNAVKANELFKFYNEIKVNDVVSYQIGKKVMGIGIINGGYSYDSAINCPHLIDVEWKLNDIDLTYNRGLLTTVYEITHQNMIDKINSMLNSIQMTNKKPTHFPLNQILFGPPGTGKTYNTINKALEITGENLEGKSREEIKKLFDQKVEEGQIVFTTFHQSMSYEDFIEGIKPLKPEIDEGYVKYDVIPGVFKSLCRKAELPSNQSFENAYNKLITDLEEKGEIKLEAKDETFTIYISPNGKDLSVKSNTYINKIYKEGLDYVSKSNKFVGLWGQFYKSIFQYMKEMYAYKESEKVESKNFVLIIDEINRGNVSQIFGELISLIEEDKRQGNAEALEVVLPYSKEKFSVPPNLYILGTMNTADRSVEAIDTALRRRFSFEEILPRYDLDELKYEFAGFKGFEILQTLNTRIEKLLDKDHQIGHSYLMLKNGEKGEEKLTTSFYKNIIPLLQEYFFGDYGKIGLLLGKGFVKKKEWQTKTDSFADLDYPSASDFDEREVFEIVDYRKSHPNHSLKINNTRMEMNFEKAIKLLMNHNIE